ncbi:MULTISPECIES: AraC family transcriptional regulator [Bacteroides]|jgi:AraC-like DNA-binding protein|uniref:AraC family transcriptional regulator n=1 Tax=Bacteroides TaxID=816 RepID=UPI001F245B70|nr:MULTISPECIES: AraC family transcriptional regulator [Bacteroides]
MKILNEKNTLSLQMLYAGYHMAGKEWCYKNVISPFSRMYLIDEGEAAVYMNKKKYYISAGELFIIPKFTFHMYECDNFMNHYYICFFDQLIGGQSLFDNTQIHYQLPANEMDRMLMLRFIELNPNCAIQNPDPKTYDNIPDIYTINQNKVNYNLSQEIESNGILLQLFSRFLGNTQLLESKSRNQYERLTDIFSYIDNHLYQNIHVSDLAEQMCLSSDHFTRIFKQVSGMSPIQYIQAKRIERAQTLLLASRLSIKEIAETVGIPNLSQFSKLFTKETGHSPREYRDNI